MADSLNPNPEGPFTAPEPTPSAVSGSEQVTLSRLDSQIAWYDHRSRINRTLYKCLKTMIIASAAAIPVLTTAGLPHGTHIAAALGVSIAVLEGVQQLNQYQANWASYRGTAEALKHEKYFYLANGRPLRQNRQTTRSAGGTHGRTHFTGDFQVVYGSVTKLHE